MAAPKLAPGYNIAYNAAGTPIAFVPPGGRPPPGTARVGTSWATALQIPPGYFDPAPAPAPPTGTNAPAAPPPPDYIYQNDVASANRTHDTTISGLTAARGRAAADYGYTPTYDEQGLIRSLAVDPNNPYAKANLLRKSYTEGRARSLNNMAGRGQLYAGAYGVAGNIADENYQAGSDRLQKAFTDFIARNQGQITGANTNYANQLAAADSNRIARATG